MKLYRGSIIYWTLIAGFFYVFLCILRFIWGVCVPLNTDTDIAAAVIAVFILFPLSLISTEKLLQFVNGSIGREL